MTDPHRTYRTRESYTSYLDREERTYFFSSGFFSGSTTYT